MKREKKARKMVLSMKDQIAIRVESLAHYMPIAKEAKREVEHSKKFLLKQEGSLWESEKHLVVIKTSTQNRLDLDKVKALLTDEQIDSCMKESTVREFVIVKK